MYRLHGAIHAYGGTTVSARDTADSVISALTPAAWYRNATGVTSAGGFASQWDDYSGNGRHLVQATGTNQPAYAAGVFTFDGADNYMSATFALNKPSSVLIVFKYLALDTDDRIYDGLLLNEMGLYQATAAPRFDLYSTAVGLVGVTTLATGSYAIFAGVYNGASSFIKHNANAAITGSVGATNATGFTLGSQGGAAANFANCEVKEVVLIPGAISEAQATAAITALNNVFTVF